MSDDNGRHFEALIELAKQQAGSSAALVEIQRHNEKHLEGLEEASGAQTVLLGKLCDHMDDMNKARDSAVEEVKKHVTERTAAGNRWLHAWALILVGLLGLAGALITWSLAHQHGGE